MYQDGIVLREREKHVFQRFACLQRGVGPGKAGPEVDNRIRLECDPHVCETSSLDRLEDPCGRADGTREAFDLVRGRPDHKCQ